MWSIENEFSVEKKESNWVTFCPRIEDATGNTILWIACSRQCLIVNRFYKQNKQPSMVVSLNTFNGRSCDFQARDKSIEFRYISCRANQTQLFIHTQNFLLPLLSPVLILFLWKIIWYLTGTILTEYKKFTRKYMHIIKCNKNN